MFKEISVVIKPILLGQAPSAKGDGRPFTGPSGSTVMRWLEVDDRDQLEHFFYLENLLPYPLSPNADPKKRDSSLTPGEARVGCNNFLARTRHRLMQEVGADVYHSNRPPTVVVCLGNKVWRGFRLDSKAPWFHWEPVSDDFLMVKFPHPSGLNHSLSDSEFVRETATRLRRIALGRIDAPHPTDPNHPLTLL